MNLNTLASTIKKNALALLSHTHGSFEIAQVNAKLAIKYGDGGIEYVPPINFRPHQQLAHDALFIQKILRLFLVRPRRAGKETESWNFLIEGALRRPGNYIMMYPSNVRGRRILWDGNITYNQESYAFRDMVPRRFIKGKPKQDEMKITLLNGSQLYVMGCDEDPAKVRGMNPFGVVFAEFAYSDPRVFQTLMPVFRENGGWALLQTTFDGMNHAYRLMQTVKDNSEWYCKVDSALTLVDESGRRYITDDMINEDRKAGMPEYLIQQEYFSSVEPNQSTIYFARELKYIDENKKIIPKLMLRKPVYTAWDIGMSDSTAIIFFQMDDKKDPVIINYIENHNMNLEWYVNEILIYCNKQSLVHKSAIFPHDGERRDFTNTANKTIVDSANELGINAISVPRPKSKLAAIQDMRQMLYRTSFNQEGTVRLIECLSSYSKVYDEKNDIYRDHALHNWASHGADAYQTMMIAIRDNLLTPVVNHGVVYLDSKQNNPYNLLLNNGVSQ